MYRARQIAAVFVFLAFAFYGFLAMLGRAKGGEIEFEHVSRMIFYASMGLSLALAIFPSMRLAQK